jgi:tetratricopeptide (TPR) repeat protein
MNRYVNAAIIMMTISSWNTLHAQVTWDGQFGGKITVEKVRTSSGTYNSGSGNSGSRSSSSGSSGSSAPAGPSFSEKGLKNLFREECSKLWKKGMDLFAKEEWKKSASAFRKAEVYDKGNTALLRNVDIAELREHWEDYDKYYDDNKWQDALDVLEKISKYPPDLIDVPFVTQRVKLVSSYRENDKGVDHFNKKEWDQAIRYFEEALFYVPDAQYVKNNIVKASFNQQKELAESYYRRKDWVNAAVHLQILVKDFGIGYSDSEMMQKFTDAQTKIGQVPNGLADFNTRFALEKSQLPKAVKERYGIE